MSETMQWKQRNAHTWEAWLEGVPAHGHVQGTIFDIGGEGFRYRYSGGVNHPSQLVFAAIQDESGWGCATLEDAQRDCEREMRRLRRWANGQGPESIEPLEWSPNADGEPQATSHGIELVLLRDAGGFRLALHLTHGEPETEGYLWASAGHETDVMAIGWTTHPTEEAAKQFAQERVALLVRWLGGDPDDTEVTQ